jgi:hypothetical protein
MAPSSDRSIAELVGDLSQNLRTLIRQEVALARAEVSQSLSNAGRSAAFIAAGGVLAFAGLLGLVAAISLGLVALGLHPAGATALVAIVLAALGYLLVRSGLSGLRSTSITPTTTVQTLKDGVQKLKGSA